jgi:hypothetical protein
MRGEVIDMRTHAIRRGSGHGTSEGWFAVTGGDPSRTRVAASASHQAVVTAGVGHATYYNSARTHLSINKDAPSPRTVHAVGRILPTPFLGGLHHLYVRV